MARLAYGEAYQGLSPDVIVSLFGVGTAVESDDATRDGVFKLKAGAELTYDFTSFMGVSGRYDNVRLDLGDTRQAFSIQTGRLLFHTGWQSRDEFALQYSHFDIGSDVPLYTGYPATPDPEAVADEHVLVLSGTFWW